MADEQNKKPQDNTQKECMKNPNSDCSKRTSNEQQPKGTGQGPSCGCGKTRNS